MAIEINERFHKGDIHKISSYSEITSKCGDFIQKGYKISSWNDRRDGSGNTFTIGQNITILSDNKLYAQWEINKWSITVDKIPTYAGNVYGTGSNFEYKSTHMISSIPNEGYRFKMWSDGIVESTRRIIIPDKDVNLSSYFDPITYYVQFNGNGNTGGSKDNLTCDYGVTYDNKLINTFEKSGYQFKNWLGPNDKTYSQYDSFSNFTSVDGSTIELSAQWYMPKQMMVYNSNNIDIKSDTLSFTALEDNSMICLKKYGTPNDIHIEYSVYGEQWKDYVIGQNIYLYKGDRVYFRSKDKQTFSKGATQYYYFVMSGKMEGNGNIMYLLDNTGEQNCVSGNYCFARLFYGCKGLAKSPTLGATVLSTGCYHQMFYNCSDLSNIEVDFQTWDNNVYTTNWVYGVKTDGVFKCPSTLPTTRGNNNIPTNWNVITK